MSKPTGLLEDDIDRGETARFIRSSDHTSRKRPIIDRLREIVSAHSAARVDGLLMDVTSAHITVQVYDALNEENRAKLVGFPVRKMVHIALKLATR